MAKEWLVIDAHHHYCPREAASKLGVVDGMDYTARMRERGSCYTHGQEIEHNINLMDAAGIDMVVINQSAWSDCGLAVCQTMNDAYARIVKEYPGRFIACAHVPLDAEPETLDELSRAVSEMGLMGLSLASSTSRFSLGSENLFPLYAKIARLDLPIVIHPTVRTPLWGGSGMLMGSGVSREYDIARSTVEVMTGVLKEFPDLKFLMPHYGGMMPGLKGRIMARWEPAGWKVPESIKGAAKSPREQEQLGLDRDFEKVFSKIYFDTAGSGGWAPNLSSAVMAIRADRLCFGTDYPFDIREAEDAKFFINNIKQLAISDEDKRKILGENAKKLFNI